MLHSYKLFLNDFPTMLCYQTPARVIITLAIQQEIKHKKQKQREYAYLILPCLQTYNLSNPTIGRRLSNSPVISSNISRYFDFLFCLVLWDKVLCSPGLPQTLYPPAFPSSVLKLQLYTMGTRFDSVINWTNFKLTIEIAVCNLKLSINLEQLYFDSSIETLYSWGQNLESEVKHIASTNT